MTRGLPEVLQHDAGSFFLNDEYSAVRAVSPYELALEGEKERQHHKTRMINFRLRKKQEKQKMIDECRRLEQFMKRQEAIVRNQAASRGPNETMSSEDTLRAVVVEREALQTQNRALRQEIERHQVFQTCIRSIQEQDQGRVDDSNVSDEQGWWVHLPDGESPFFFQPFTRNEFDAFPNPFDPDFDLFPPANIPVGTFMGWEIHRTPTSPDKAPWIRTRFTKRIPVSVDTAYQASWAKTDELMPVMVSPLGWGYGQYRKVSTLILQEFNRDARVMFQDIPGDVNYRYVFLGRSAQWELCNGTRRVAFSMMMVDPKASAGLKAEQEGVQWFTRGGKGENFLELTEIDENTTDVVQEQWVEYQSHLHAEHLMLQWTQLNIRWEQAVTFLASDQVQARWNRLNELLITM